jgi:DNA-binding beta-propeller fold protein YncE
MKLIPLLSIGLFLACGASGQSYRIAAQFPIGGTGSYDYVRYDEAGRRLFVSHQTRVEVLDADSGQSVGQITGLHGVHGIALANELGRGFISNGLNGSVTVFDLHTLAILATLKTGGDKPDAIEYDPATETIVVSNGHSNSETLIDGPTGQVRHVVKLLGNPESIAFDGLGHALVNLESHNSVALIELKSGAVLNDWPIAPGEGPTGLAIDLVSHRAFVSCGGNEKLIVIAADTGRVVAVLPVGDDSDGAAFDPGTRRAFSSNREGTLTVIQEDDAEHFHVSADVKTEFGAKTLAVDRTGHRIFLPVAQLTPGPDEDHPGPAVPGTFHVLVVQ